MSIPRLGVVLILFIFAGSLGGQEPPSASQRVVYVDMSDRVNSPFRVSFASGWRPSTPIVGGRTNAFLFTHNRGLTLTFMCVEMPQGLAKEQATLTKVNNIWEKRFGMAVEIRGKHLRGRVIPAVYPSPTANLSFQSIQGNRYWSIRLELSTKRRMAKQFDITMMDLVEFAGIVASIEPVAKR